jgi:hypothetical protein
MRDQGPPLARAIHYYLVPLDILDPSVEIRIDSLVPGRSFLPVVNDYDQRNQGSIYIDAVCMATADSERVICYRQNYDGLFAPLDPVPTNEDQAVPGDGILSVAQGSELVATYRDPLIPARVFQRFISIVQPTEIVPAVVPDNLASLRAYPNPFNSRTIIGYSDLSDAGMAVYDIKGRIVRRFAVDDPREGQIMWDATDDSGGRVSSGVYFVVDDGRRRSLKLLFVK